jgi:serine-type D-Ala-D-Ala endopeptidase (penicillin-binding protein 7)
VEKLAKKGVQALFKATVAGCVAAFAFSTSPSFALSKSQGEKAGLQNESGQKAGPKRAMVHKASARKVSAQKAASRSQALTVVVRGKAGETVVRVRDRAKVQPVRFVKKTVMRGGKPTVIRVPLRGASGRVIKAAYRIPAPPRLSYGAIAGLHEIGDPLDLRSSVAFVMDQDTKEILLEKNESAVLPIASLTKLMTGLLISENRLPMEEIITITSADVDTEKGSRSRLPVGTMLSRGELLHLALMSSENRAAHALGRTFPGGMASFVDTMNARAHSLGMRNTRYAEPTGLSSANQSTAQDLALLVAAASRDNLLRDLSTSPTYTALVGNRLTQFNTTNALVKNPDWEIGLQKTGYISEAGQCLVMQAKVAGRKLIMVFLDSKGKFSRVADAQRVKRWVEANAVIADVPRLQSAVSVKSTDAAAM